VPTKHTKDTKGEAVASAGVFTGWVNEWNRPTPGHFVCLVCFVGSNC